MKRAKLFVMCLMLLGFRGMYGYAEDLFSSVKSLNPFTVKKFLQENPTVDVNAQDAGGRTALMFAAQAKGSARENRAKQIENASKIIDQLIEKGAGLNVQDEVGKTALMYAIEAKNISLADQLLQKGADVNIREDDSGKTALAYSVELGNVPLTEQLIKKGAKVNITYVEQTTP